jgi:hypothetical protein
MVANDGVLLIVDVGVGKSDISVGSIVTDGVGKEVDINIDQVSFKGYC